MIVLVGDTHGEHDFRKLSNRTIRAAHGTLPNFVIQLGDFGCPWSDNIEDKTDRYLCNWYSEKPYDIIVIPGNHENYNRLEKMPIEIYHGARVRRYSSNIVFVERNQVLELEDKRFYCLGGAESTDKQFRTLYRDWWPQEEANYADFLKAKSLLRRVKRVDYVVSHTAPESAIFQLGYDRFDGTSKLLEYIKENLAFNHWYFGHFHSDITFEKFSCLYNQTRRLS